MELGGMKRTVAMSLLVALLVAALAGEASATCSLSQLRPCSNAVTQGEYPPQACCDEVASADVVCFCNLVQSGNYPPNLVDNALTVPQKCGGAAYANFKGKTCAGHYIS